MPRGPCTRDGSPPGSVRTASGDHFPHREPGVLHDTYSFDLHPLVVSPRRSTRRGDLDQVISNRADAGLHAIKAFLPIHSFIFLICTHQTPETLVPLLRLPTSNKTILPAKQAACDLCGWHDRVIQRLPLENWSAVVLRKA